MGAARAAKAQEIHDLTDTLRKCHDELAELGEALDEAKEAYHTIYRKAHPDAGASQEPEVQHVAAERVHALRKLVADGTLLSEADLAQGYAAYQASMVDSEEPELNQDQWRNAEYAHALSRFLLGAAGATAPQEELPTQREQPRGVKHGQDQPGAEGRPKVARVNGHTP